MSAFAIIATSMPDRIEATVKRTYPDDYLAISESVWLVADTNVTTQGVCKRLGIQEGGVDNAVVIKADNYWGRAPRNIWEWLSVKGASP